MPVRLLHFRFTFAVLAMLALLCGAWFESVWLAAPGVAAACVSEAIALVQMRTRFAKPVERSLRGAAEALPAVGVAAYDPWALGVTVGVVLFALMANGMMTVAAARGAPPGSQPGETLRRLLTAMAGLMILAIPLAVTSSLNLPAELGTDARSVVLVATAVVMLAGLRALLDMALSARRV